MDVLQNFPSDGSYQAFIEQHLMKNEPCLLGEWATGSWGARRKWVKEDGSPNFSYLSKEYGHAIVSVADCMKNHFSTHQKTDMTLAEYLEYWQAHQSEGCQKGQSTIGDQLLYLKDWHFTQQFPEQKEVSYCTPLYMRSDWLNEVWSAREDVADDYRFVYMGPAGTWTPFHVDVLRSYSWSANITGCKEWLLFPPEQEEFLKDKLGNLPFDVTSEEMQEKIKSGQAPPPIRVIQGPGEIIFVPSGWHHQVRNLEPTISINHNWTNAFGVRRMWQHLQHELELVKQELLDCAAMDGWQRQCQVVLRASAGMDYWEFAQFIVVLALPRLKEFESLVSTQCVSLTPIVTLKQFIQQVSTHSNTLTFFGALPPTCPSPPDDLGKCLHPEKPFTDLLLLLPHQLRQVVETRECKGLVETSLLSFRSLELHMLSSVAEELKELLPHP